MSEAAALDTDDLPTITPMDAACGAEVGNIDLSRPLSDAQFAAIEEAFQQHLVLVFRGQPLSDEEQLAFGQRFGELEGHINKPTQHKKLPKVQVFSNIKEDGTTLGVHPEKGTLVWHTDKSYVATPSMATILRSPAIASEGGDTLFANCQVAYDDLDDAMKQRTEGLRAIHSWKRSREKPATQEQITAAPPIDHPVARTHPGTGRKGIYAGCHSSHVVDMDHDDGVKLLKQLEDHAAQDKCIYRHKWQENDVLMWDNRGTMHCVTPYDAVKEKRAIHRVVVKGERPL